MDTKTEQSAILLTLKSRGGEGGRKRESEALLEEKEDPRNMEVDTNMSPVSSFEIY